MFVSHNYAIYMLYTVLCTPTPGVQVVAGGGVRGPPCHLHQVSRHPEHCQRGELHVTSHGWKSCRGYTLREHAEQSQGGFAWSMCVWCLRAGGVAITLQLFTLLPLFYFSSQVFHAVHFECPASVLPLKQSLV